MAWPAVIGSAEPFGPNGRVERVQLRASKRRERDRP
jgi:hypothetical protein